MHLNPTLSAPGGPGSSWGDRENPKPQRAGGLGALHPPQPPPVCRPLSPSPRRGSPLGRRSEKLLDLGGMEQAWGWSLLSWRGPGVRSVGPSGLGLCPISSLVPFGTRRWTGVKSFGSVRGAGAALYCCLPPMDPRNAPCWLVPEQERGRFTGSEGVLNRAGKPWRHVLSSPAPPQIQCSARRFNRAQAARDPLGSEF